jgi:hypothetical protein
MHSRGKKRPFEPQKKRYYPAWQRVVLLDFASVEDAEAWDEAGQPLELTLPQAVTVTVMP